MSQNKVKKQKQDLQVIKNQIKHKIVKNMSNVPKATHIIITSYAFLPTHVTLPPNAQVLSDFLCFFFSFPFLSILVTCLFLFDLYLHNK